MKTIGHVESLWRYPVKSMRGEQLPQAFVGFAGIYGDRVYAFRSSAAPKGFPFLTAREKEELLKYVPRFRHADIMAQPPNAAEAEALAPGATPVYASAEERALDVETPSGEVFAIDDPGLIGVVEAGLRERHELSLLRSDRAMTDCRPISMFSIQTVQKLGEELGAAMDKRRFRANVYVELASGTPFGENELVGHSLRIGARTVVAITDRDPRCKMITLDPDSTEANPAIMRRVAREHEGKLGVYGAVLIEGPIRTGDEITLIS